MGSHMHILAFIGENPGLHHVRQDQAQKAILVCTQRTLPYERYRPLQANRIGWIARTCSQIAELLHQHR
jgi:hypothetical protein